MKRIIFVFVVFIVHQQQIHGLDNGLARIPPMGWLSWIKFLCEIDCESHPHSCINEQLYKDMADRLVADGYKDAGYTLVNIDDCWPAMKRTSKGRLTWNATRFPSGIPALAEYMHARGLKLGIYEDYGKKTCAGYPGSLGHLKVDAETLVSWNIDMLKFDGCNSNFSTMSKGYPQMSKYLNQTNRPIIFSCEWPLYERRVKTPDYQAIARACNMWRNDHDIGLSWQSVLSIIDYFTQMQDVFIPVNGPGQWNDPDMIIVGNDELTLDQARAQMTIWSIWSAPLLMSNDLRMISPLMRDILLNKDVISIDQDPLGVMGRLVANETNVGVFVKKMLPAKGGQNSYAVAFLNRNKTAKADVSATLSDLGLSNPAGYRVRDVWNHEELGLLKPSDEFRGIVPPTGVILLKATVH